jgi:hypothetical protein
MGNITKNQRLDLPDFITKVSLRAKHVWLKITGETGLVVVVPKGFDTSRIPSLLSKEKEWIERNLHRIITRYRQYRSFANELPEEIPLAAIGQTWKVKYHKASCLGLHLYEDDALTVSLWGDVEDVDKCRIALSFWLRAKAKRYLVPLLKKISREKMLPFQNVSIKGQKTIWASCSQNKNLNINYKLLMIPRKLVHYVFLHELCHTRHMNHSRHFWALVKNLEPGYREYDSALRTAWRALPAWVHK